MNAMNLFFEWKPIIEEKKVKFACTNLKGHSMIQWDHVQKDRTKNRKDKIKPWNKMGKNCKKCLQYWTMHRLFFVRLLMVIQDL